MLKLPTFECIRPLHIKLNQSKDVFDQHYNKINKKLNYILLLFYVLLTIFPIFISLSIVVAGDLTLIKKLICISMFLLTPIASGILSCKLVDKIGRSKFFQRILMKKGQVLKDNTKKARYGLYEYLIQPDNIARLIKETQQLKPFLNTKEIENLENNESWIKTQFVQGHFQNIEELIGEQNLKIVLDNFFYFYEQAVKKNQHIDNEHKLDNQFNVMAYGEKCIAIGENHNYELKKNI